MGKKAQICFYSPLNHHQLFTFVFRISSEFCRQLNDLVNLAPPIQAISDSTSHDSPITDLIQTERFQSILVTHFHHLETDVSISESENKDSHRDDDGSIHFGDNDDVEEEDEQESFDPPWPSDHEGFCALPQVQEHVLLEIAAGCNSKGRTIKPMELPKGRLRVVLPGSLRERGEFCVVDVSFMKMTGAAAVSSKHEDYRWIVRRTRFHTINDYY